MARAKVKIQTCPPGPAPAIPLPAGASGGAEPGLGGMRGEGMCVSRGTPQRLAKGRLSAAAVARIRRTAIMEHNNNGKVRQL